MRNWAFPSDLPGACSHIQHAPDLTTSKLENWGRWEQSGGEELCPSPTMVSNLVSDPPRASWPEHHPAGTHVHWGCCIRLHALEETGLCWQQVLVSTEKGRLSDQSHHWTVVSDQGRTLYCLSLSTVQMGGWLQGTLTRSPQT